jgi:hypothetical protein
MGSLGRVGRWTVFAERGDGKVSRRELPNPKKLFSHAYGNGFIQEVICISRRRVKFGRVSSGENARDA